MASRRKGRSGDLKYTKLKELSAGKRVNVVGVVSSYYPPRLEADCCICSLSIIDESKLEIDCVMSHAMRDSLPPLLYPGDILFLRGVVTEGVAPQVALKTDKQSGWVVFVKREGFKPHSSSVEHAIGTRPSEKLRLEDLKKWSTRDIIQSTPIGSQLTCPESSASSPARTGHTPSSHLAYANSSPFPSHDRKKTHPQPQVSRPTKNRFYETRLSAIADLVIGSKAAGLMGVVKYFKPPERSRGIDCFTTFCVADSSSKEGGVICVLFNPSQDRLPVVRVCGEVVMVKGVAIRTYDGSRQAMGHENTLVGIFPSDAASPLPTAIGNFYTMKDSEKKRLQEVRNWASAVGLPLLINSKMEEISVNSFCSNLSLVLAVFEYPADTSDIVLVVTDGTAPRFRSSTNIEAWKIRNCSHRLFYLYHNLSGIVRVCTASKPGVAAGDVVQFANIRAMAEGSGASLLPDGGAPATQGDSLSEELTAELRVMDHACYQGGVKVLATGSSVAQSFRESLPVPEGPQPVWKPVISRLVVSTSILAADAGKTTLAQLQLPEVKVGSERTVTVQVIGLGRVGWSSLEDMTQLRCPACMTHYLTPRPSMSDFEELVTAGDPCVCCGEDGGEGVALCYMYAFPLLVADHTAQLEVAVSGLESGKFMLQDPVNLYSDLSARECLLDLLYTLTGGNDPFHRVPLDPRFSQPRPSFDITVTIMKSSSGLRLYRIIDTTLQVNQLN